MIVKKKIDAVNLSKSLTNTEKEGFPFEYPTIYFYNKDTKRHNYIINYGEKIGRLSFIAMDERNTLNKVIISEPDKFIWKHRKDINKQDGNIQHTNLEKYETL